MLVQAVDEAAEPGPTLEAKKGSLLICIGRALDLLS
jgi:hypothetical protein